MRVAILATGGTILGASNNRLDFIDYRAGVYTINQVLETIPEIKNIADITMEQLESLSSSEITVSHWAIMKEKVEHYINDQGYDGIVIVHGTNTIEETAYFLNLTVNSNKPIIIVGSQRPFTALGTDAEINLINAIRLAVSPQAHNKGVLVVLNDEINAAREVTKTNTYRLETFQSGQLGFLGYVDVDHTVQFYRAPTRLHTANSCFSKISLENLPDVAILYSYAGASGDIIRMVTDCQRYKGIVMAGGGAGKVSQPEKEALQRAVKKGISVVRSSRVGNGRVVELSQYKDFAFIAGDNLTPQKARILLMLALKIENDPRKIEEMFKIY